MAPITSAITRVLITGFGPFQGVPNNPSFGIAARLPLTLPNNIELMVHGTEVPVAYHPTINLIPRLYSEVQPDLSLHIGVAEGRKYFAVEQTSQRKVYQWVSDIEGRVFSEEEDEIVWGGKPTTLSTELNLDAVVAEWQNRTADIKWPLSSAPNPKKARSETTLQAGSPIEVKLVENVMIAEEVPEGEMSTSGDVRWSDNVGNYLCGFIYYAAMAEMGANGKNKKRHVSFMHVPMLRTEEELQTGVDVTIELIQSLVNTWRAQEGA